MTEAEPPKSFGQDGKGEGKGADEWAYGTSIERPLPASSGTGQAVDPPGGATGDVGKENRTADDKGTNTRKEPGRRSRSDTDAPADKPGRRADEAKPGREPAGKEGDEPPAAPRKTVFVVAGLVLLGLLAWGSYKHWQRNSDAETTSQRSQDQIPEVRTTEAKRDDKPIDLTLPGQTEAFETANIFARATGYITKRNVDIGSRVSKGDLLVHITAPDLDQQLAQATAQLGQVKAAEAQAGAQVTQAEANLNLAKVTLARTATLTQQGYETLQNRDNQVANQQSQQASLDTARAGVKVAEANTKAQQATVERLLALAGFEDVVAPFSGIITTRNVDQGDLVNADTSSATPMFAIARDDVIRVTVQVPQNASAGVRDGVSASIEVPSGPGQRFAGTVTRSSVALLSSARTLDTEVDVPNPDGRIRPGLFVYVTMHIPREHPDVVVPAEALIFNQSGMQVATVDGEHAKMVQVKIFRDFGTTVSLSEGLQGGEQIIVSPPALLHDGAAIKPKPRDDGKKPDGDQKPGDDGKPSGGDGQAKDGGKTGGKQG